MTYDDPTDRLLRELDPAERTLTTVQRDRAAADLERIVASDPAPMPVRRRPGLVLVAVGIAALVAAAVVLVPVLTRGEEAFATWSPTPVELEGGARATALRACVVLQAGGGGDLALDRSAPASALVAEARGGWDYVAFTASGPTGLGLHGTCLMPDDLVADPRPGQGGFFGSLDRAGETAGPAPGRTVARQDTSGAGSVDGELFVYVEGRAGTDVVRIDLTTPGGVRVEASVDDGRWAAWWPAGDASPRNPGIAEAPAYDVTLRDGTVTHDVDVPR